MSFIPLHVYTGYSFLQSGITEENYLKALKKRGFKGSGITDFNSLSGVPHFYKALKQEKLNLLAGVDFLIDDNLLSFFALNEVGYRNLLKILFIKRTGNLTYEEVRRHKEGLAVVLAIAHSKLHSLFAAERDQIPHFLLPVSNLGEHFYLGIEFGVEEDELFVAYMRDFARTHGYQTIAFPFIRYIEKKDAIVLEIAKAIRDDSELAIQELEGSEYLLTKEEIARFFTEQEIENTNRLLKLSSFRFEEKRGHLLRYQKSDDITSDAYLKNKALEGLRNKIPVIGEEYLSRLNYELDVIAKMGYSDYFLIVSDYVAFAREHGISVGPGRGSAAGSLVSYALGIVSCDPIKHNLLFERFLNPERQSMPDIDIDFSDVRRSEVIDYLRSKYGRDKVANIMTIQTIGAKQALRDIGRVYKIETREIDMISKLIIDANSSLRENYRKNPAFKKLVDSDKYYLNIVSLAALIEGLPRQSGLHAAGIILNDSPLEEVLPVNVDFNGDYIAEYEMNYLEEQGFLKMDILGLRNLSIIDECLSLIRQNRGISLNYQEIPFEDKKAIRIIKEGRTMGLFQLESAGMKKAISTLEPEGFEDIVALLALFRPGPMDNIPSYARRKKKKEPIVYPSKALEEILASTYGIIVYQEQITQIVRKMANFSYGQADVFRRAISKKDSAQLSSLEQNFVASAIKNGYSHSEAKSVFDLIYKFADYGFNRSHSLCYAVLACQMAYLKTYYTPEFYAAILGSSSGSNDTKFNETLNEVRKMGIKILNPDINRSGQTFIVKDGALIFPLFAVKGILGALVDAIIKERNNGGPFTDFFDFVARMIAYKINQNQIGKLIDAGAFDNFAISRSSLRATINSALRYGSMLYSKDGQMIIDLPFSSKPRYTEAFDDPLDNLDREYEALGLMISGSPLTYKQDAIKKYPVIAISDARESQSPTMQIVGVIRTVKVINTRSGTPMAFLNIYDDSGDIDITIFAKTYALSYEFLKKKNIVRVIGYMDRKRENVFIANEIIALEE
ncbi:MAG: DNA polymerase III subunit alpha [Bacilli bacterium]|nr:DNA polymerase III subunit alpha [Bacilli bacterium]